MSSPAFAKATAGKPGFAKAKAGTALVELTAARLREFIREPEAIFWTFVFPILMSIAMAVAFPARGATPVILAIEAGEGFEAARQALSQVPGIDIRDVPADQQDRALRDGDVHLIVVPASPPTYRFDPQREEGRTARLIVDDALQRAAGRSDRFTAHVDPLAAAGSRYIDWLIPGLIGLGIMSTGMWGLGFSIVQARMRKVLKLLVASPMRKHEYLAAQLLARLAFLAPEVAVPLAFGALVLGMPIAGSILSITVVSLIGALAFAALGLLAATRARTFEAISGLMNLLMTPMWILSGVFFASSNFPDALQPFIQVLPLTALIDALRGVILEGAHLGEVGGELALLGGWGTVSFGLALYFFRWR